MYADACSRHHKGVLSEQSAYVPNALLGRLVGFRLYSVQFVMDYVQFRFDGPTEDMPVLNCDVLPVVETPSGPVAAGQVGYADALRAFIPSRVVATVEATGQGIRIEFDDRAICLHPDIDEVLGPEIALLGGLHGRQLDVLAPRVSNRSKTSSDLLSKPRSGSTGSPAATVALINLPIMPMCVR
jgi:hypothetical protein